MIFIIFGCVITMNLIVALMITKVNVSNADTILLKRRVVEMSEMTQLEHLFFNTAITTLANTNKCSFFTNRCLRGKSSKYPDQVSVKYDLFESADSLLEKIKNKIGFNRRIWDHIRNVEFRNHIASAKLVELTVQKLKEKMERRKKMMDQIRKVQRETQRQFQVETQSHFQAETLRKLKALSK